MSGNSTALPTLDTATKRVLAQAEREALIRKHAYVGPEHILLALSASTSPAHSRIIDLGLSYDSIAESLDRFGEPVSNPHSTDALMLSERSTYLLTQAALTASISSEQAVVCAEGLLAALLAEPVGLLVEQIFAEAGVLHPGS